MTPAERARMEFQAPQHSPRNVCCHCKRPTTAYGFTAPDGHWVETHHCPEHGDVVPMRSVISNPW